MNNKITYTKVGDYYILNLTLEECQNQFEILMKQFTEKQNITEELKANN